VTAVLGAVACGHAEAAGAAATLLRAGGNAFDAAVAAAFAACVAEPMFTSLGGGGFLLARAADGDERLYDFFADTPGRGLGTSAPEPHFEPMTVHFPASDQVFNIGLGSVAVPGTLAGLLHVHGARGCARLRDVVAPAVSLARDGVRLNAHQAYVIGLLRPINTLTADGSALYAPGGRGPAAGERLRNPQLAAFLERLPDEGPSALYGGAVARAVAEDMRDGGGLLTEEDLARYRVIERAPLALEIPGLPRVLTNPPPAFGGALLAASLELHAGLGTPAWGSAAYLVQLVAVMQEVERGRDGAAVHAVTGRGAAAPAEAGSRAAALRRVRRATGGTTHVSVLDRAGNAASLSLSNGEGSGYVARGTGIMLNNMLGEDDLHPDGFHASPPGERIASMMSPTLVLHDGRTRLVLGSGGSKRIRSAIAQVLLGVVAHGRDLETSVLAPRVHWDGACVQAEPGFADAALADLERRWPVNRWPERNLYFGGVHVAEAPAVHAATGPAVHAVTSSAVHAVTGSAVHAVTGSDSVLRAAADPRREGAALVVSG